MKPPSTAPDPGIASPPRRYDVARVRRDFPLLARTVHGKPLVYLDNAATTQKPQAVIDALVRYYATENANIHRGVYHLSEVATEKYEASRARVAAFLGAASPREIVFTRGTTESINLVAATFGRQRVGKGDEILITGLEHHSNIVPWQLLAQERGAVLRVARLDERGEVPLEAFARALTDRTRLVALSHMSNALGTINPVKDMIALAHEREIPALVDGAQAAPHLPVDVQNLDADFYALSGHKLYGPTGIGVLYGKLSLLEAMPPYQGGGEMIASVTYEKTTYNRVPHKFEAGTPNVAGAIALHAALDYVDRLGKEAIAAHEAALLRHATERVAAVPGVRLIGTAARKAGILSFVLEGIHPHDLGTILDLEGVAIRAGHHCAQPIMDHFGVPATARVSLALYNTRDEIDRLVAGLHTARKAFRL